jgi:hypothetical protein
MRSDMAWDGLREFLKQILVMIIGGKKIELALWAGNISIERSCYIINKFPHDMLTFFQLYVVTISLSQSLCERLAYRENGPGW